jgi:hypothetical protein
MELEFTTVTNCYFGPRFVPVSRLLFLFVLAILVPWTWRAIRRSPTEIAARLHSLRLLLLLIVSPSIALMAMALHWWASVEYPDRLTLVHGPSDPLLSVFRGQLAWFIARPVLSLLLLLILLATLQKRLRTPSPVPHGTA